MIDPERIKQLNAANILRGKYVLYWMQASQRAHYNHALEYAVTLANEYRLPLLVCFGLTNSYPDSELSSGHHVEGFPDQTGDTSVNHSIRPIFPAFRNYRFMLEGLSETAGYLERRGIACIVLTGEPWKVAAALSKDAALVVVDCGYLRHQREWRNKLAVSVDIPVIQVEADVIVPVKTASNKQEFAARTIRPKLQTLFPQFFDPVPEVHVKKESLNLDIPNHAGFETLDLGNWQDWLDRFTGGRPRLTAGGFDAFEAVISGGIESADLQTEFSTIKGGYQEARRRLYDFLKGPFLEYYTRRNDPSLNIRSGLSPYLHFGQISPLEIVEKVKEYRGPPEAEEAFIEELFIRRELSMNHVYYNPRYDSYEGLPEWARKTLNEHAADKRPFYYELEQLLRAETHDPYWNAAMKEMVLTGSMHSYMRMYWGKKIIEWSDSPEGAFETMLGLNNRFFLDGRDSNSYAGVAWCFGAHDRPWKERNVFGKVRYMNSNGLERKFDMKRYIEWVERLEDGTVHE